jgi:hypothetical protein
VLFTSASCLGAPLGLGDADRLLTDPTGLPRHIQAYYATDDAPISPEAEKALLWKQDKRIVPLSAAIYFLCYLDRSNIGNAKILNASTHHDLLSETGMTNYQFTIALMIFLVAYGLFEVPSNGELPPPPPFMVSVSAVRC